MLRKMIVKALFEPYLPLSRLKHTVRFPKPKVRLVAVAKNEGRYLAEWILHHLYFGVAHVEVHYNQCDDNTAALGQYLQKRYPVTFIDADASFNNNQKAPQVSIYREAIKRAYRDGFSHVLFLDVDEFLLPKDMRQSISSLLHSNRQSDVICFHWANKLEDKELFGLAVERELTVELSPTIKSCVKTFIAPLVMNPHTVVSDNLIYSMSGKVAFESTRKDKSKVTNEQHVFSKTDFIVLHRQYRSELEYIAMLGRGRPVESAKQPSIFKNNRRGYNIHSNRTNVVLPEDAFEKYEAYISEHTRTAEIQNLLSDAEILVLKRYNRVLEMLETAPTSEDLLLKRLLKNITLDEINEIVNRRKKHALSLDEV